MTRLVRCSVLCFVVLSLIGCERTVSWNQKLTLYFSTPDGRVQASSVIQVRAQHPTNLSRMIPAGIHGLKTSVTGEAVVADLGEGKYVFALLPEMANVLRGTLMDTGVVEGLSGLAITQKMKDQLEPLEVPRNRWPQLVTFTDLNDPTSVKLIDADNLRVIFGSGYALRDVTVQSTYDPITYGKVEQVLNWLAGYNKWLTLSLPNGEERLLSPSEFNSGVYEK